MCIREALTRIFNMSTAERLYIEINIRKIDIELIGGGFRISGGCGGGRSSKVDRQRRP